MKNYDKDDNNKNLEKEFAEAVRMLEQAQKAAKDRQLMDTELREINTDLKLKILDLKDEVISLREENEKLRGETRQIDLSEKGNLFFATGLNTPVCYNCSIEKNRPVILTIENGVLYRCNTCDGKFLYRRESTD